MVIDVLILVFLAFVQSTGLKSEKNEGYIGVSWRKSGYYDGISKKNKVEFVLMDMIFISRPERI